MPQTCHMSCFPTTKFTRFATEALFSDFFSYPFRLRTITTFVFKYSASFITFAYLHTTDFVREVFVSLARLTIVKNRPFSPHIVKLYVSSVSGVSSVLSKLFGLHKIISSVVTDNCSGGLSADSKEFRQLHKIIPQDLLLSSISS